MNEARQLELTALPRPHSTDWDEVLDRHRLDPVAWELLGEGSQDPGWTEPA